MECSERCYVCKSIVAPKHEHDHFPVPKRMGGEAVLCICVNCHTIKDRMGLAEWNPSTAFTALAGLWEKATTDERMMLAKLFHVASNDSSWIVERALERETRDSTGSGVPYGYALVEVESEQVTLHKARTLRAAGLSLRAVAAELDRLGMHARNGRPFAAVQIARMVVVSGDA